MPLAICKMHSLLLHENMIIASNLCETYTLAKLLLTNKML